MQMVAAVAEQTHVTQWTNCPQVCYSLLITAMLVLHHKRWPAVHAEHKRSVLLVAQSL